MTPALTQLGQALRDLAAALETGRADEVLAVEARLSEVVAQARAWVSAARVKTVDLDRGSDVRELIAAVRDGMARCRRLGATVPALLSIMYPGQIGYGPSGARESAAPVRPALTQVI